MALDFSNLYQQVGVQPAQQMSPVDYAQTTPQGVLDFFSKARPFDRYTDAQGYNWMRDLQGGGGVGDSSSPEMTLNGYRRSLRPGEQVGQSETTNLYYGNDGKYSHDYYDAKGWLNPLTGILAVAGFGLGASALAGGAGAAAGGAGAAEAAGAGVGAGAGESLAAGAGLGAGSGTTGNIFGMGLGGMGEAGAGYGLGAGSTYGGSAIGSGLAGSLGAGGAALGAGYTGPTTFGVVDEAAGALSAAGGAGASAPSWLQQLGGAGSSLAGGGGGGGSGGMRWQDLAGIGAQLYNGYQGGQAAESASAAQLQAAREAMALTAPWREKGVAGLNKLAVMLGLDGQGSPEYGQLVKDFQFTQDDPSYQFRLNQGLKTLKNSYAGKGKFLSGAAMKGINDYAQGAASQEFGQAFNRDLATRTNLYNRLAGIAGTGQTASNTMGEYGTQAGNAQAAGEIGKASAWSDALGGAYSTYSGNELMNRLLRSRGA